MPLAYLAAFFFFVTLFSCENHTGLIKEIRLSSPGNNILKVKISFVCTDVVDAVVKYWDEQNPGQQFSTLVSSHKESHSFVLTNLRPATKYKYTILTTINSSTTESKTYDFSTKQLPFWLKDAFVVLNPKPQNIPADFKKGYIMLYQRDDPGTIYIVNQKGEIVWYHRVDNTGFKVAHFTNLQTILSILGDSKYETSYGNQILELSLTGDTLLNLKKGIGDFKQTVHHEVLLTPENNIATITVEDKIVDLSAVGGKKNDTIKTDGIIILNREGNKVWQWSVADVLNPLKGKNILKEKKDWMHANSLCYTPDGNFLISFYNNGQIWKIDSKTGKLMWKFGREGDFEVDGELPEQCHAVHYTSDSTIMLFDNGTSAKISHIFKFWLDESNKQAYTAMNISLPKDAYNERMGSAYMVGDTSIITCASKRNLIILSNITGSYLWIMNTSGISPYRAEFISPNQVKPFLSE